jgi:Tfp pilus assembly protein PilN
MQSINLVPENIVQEQTEQKAVKLSTIVCILLAVVASLVSGILWYVNGQTSARIKSLNSEIDQSRNAITALAPVEVSTRNLDKKFTTLKGIFAERDLYSLLVTELMVRKPTGIGIRAVSLQKGVKLNINGTADNYISIAAFTNNLVNSNFEGGNTELRKLFTAVTLNSVDLEKSRNDVLYSINVDMDDSLLRSN